jgi:hypothetical protein
MNDRRAITDNRNEQGVRPDPCGYSVGTAVCRIPVGHLRMGIPHHFERAEHIPKEYVRFGPVGAIPLPVDENRLGQVAYEAYQGQYAKDLSDATAQNAASKKPVPTGDRVAWKKLDRATQATWIRVAMAVRNAR